MRSLFVLFLLSGCQSLITEPKQDLNPNTLYQRDMIVQVNGTTFEGVGVVDMKPVNDFHVTARGDLNLFTMSTCHRETKKESAWNVQETVPDGLFGWGSKKIDATRDVTFQYAPDELESQRVCPLELAGYDKNGRHSWAFIDFKTPAMSLPGHLACNGVARDFTGVDACQSKTGLFQSIEFKVPVRVSPDYGCEIGQPESGKFTFPIPKGKCVYIFQEVNGDRLARITLIGYDSILIREN